MRKATCVKEGRGHTVPAPGSPCTVVTCLPMHHGHPPAHAAVVEVGKQPYANASVYCAWKWAFCHGKISHCTHRYRTHIAQYKKRLLANLWTRCASRLGLCAISKVSFHFFSGSDRKVAFPLGSSTGHGCLKSTGFSLRSTYPFISSILLLTFHCSEKNLSTW